MEKVHNALSNDKKKWTIDFSGNFREILRDTMMAHTAALLICSMYVILLIRQPDKMLVGVLFLFVLALSLLVIAAWLLTSLRASYRKMIPSVIFRRACLIFHMGIFEVVFISSLIYAAKGIATSLAH